MDREYVVCFPNLKLNVSGEPILYGGEGVKVDFSQEIVRCEECKHYITKYKNNFCEKFNINGSFHVPFTPPDEFYCKFGKRKEKK